MKFLLTLLFCLSSSSVVFAKEQLQADWTSQRLPAAIWGIAKVNSKHFAMLQKNSLQLGDFKAGKFQLIAEYQWSPTVVGLRVFSMDLDSDGHEELVVSAIQRGVPASFALKIKQNKLEPFFEHTKWHLRVAKVNGKNKVLLGQRSRSSKFFAGKVFQLKFQDNQLKKVAPLSLPRGTRLFQFALIENKTENQQVVLLKDHRPLSLFEKRGKRFRAVWYSIQNHSGSFREIAVLEREIYGIVRSDKLTLEHEPVSQAGLMLAARHVVPLRSGVGKKAWVRSGGLLAYRADAGLVFKEKFKTEELPGVIVDYLLDKKGENGKTQLLVALQLAPNVFAESRESVLLRFDLNSD